MHLGKEINSRNQILAYSAIEGFNVVLTIKREDKIHPEIAGNKWRKLKYNLQWMQQEGIRTLVTFGGAYSNHIAATAAMCRIEGVNGIGIIRGERIDPLNPTLKKAEDDGMQLHFISRTEYRNDKLALVEQLVSDTAYHVIPEGGANELGVSGCMEIIDLEDKKEHDIIACAAGTGTMAAGLLRSLSRNQRLKVYSALKGDFLAKEIIRMAGPEVDSSKLEITDEFCQGGYAKINPEFLGFVKHFFQETGIRLDPVYTGKLMFGIVHDIQEGVFPPGSRILCIHSGGLQGVKGMEERFNISLFEK